MVWRETSRSVKIASNAHSFKKMPGNKKDEHPRGGYARGGAESVERQFHALLATWRDETAGLSSTTKIVMNDAYQQIIGLGEPAVPLLLRELAKGPDHLGWALRAITREDPVPRDAAGDVQRVADIWLEWGRNNDKM
jgi:hypothetical protein